MKIFVALFGLCVYFMVLVKNSVQILGDKRGSVYRWVALRLEKRKISFVLLFYFSDKSVF